MFNIGTDTLEDNFVQATETHTYELIEGDLGFLELAPAERTDHSTPDRPGRPPSFDESPVHNQQQNFVFLPTARNIPQNITNRIEPTWRPKDILVKKFVDDNLSTEKLCYKDIPTIETDSEILRNARAGQSEKMFKHITKNAT